STIHQTSNWTDQSGRILMTRRSRRQRHLPRTAPETQEKNYTKLQFLFMQIFVLTGFKRKLRFKSAEPPKNI
ncbi:TPA: hypothetical protein ACLATL_001637, partial [Neisseria meningitidis]